MRKRETASLVLSHSLRVFRSPPPPLSLAIHINPFFITDPIDWTPAAAFSVPSLISTACQQTSPTMEKITTKPLYDEYAEFIVNARGLKLFTYRWIPRDEPVAIILLCHGYSMECSISMRGTATRLAEAGYAVYGVDYEGHGKSSGLKVYVRSFENIVKDCADYFGSICERPENKAKKRYLFGESMGGAVALFIHRKQPTFYHGAVLVVPMCKISDEMKPPSMFVSLLGPASRMFPKWRAVPTLNMLKVANKTPERRQELLRSPYCDKGRPRLRTAYELLRASTDLEENLNQISLPFLVVHGGADIITDPSVSQLLYESAKSSDKTFKLYPGMWHALTSGEPLESINLVFSDILSWLNARAKRTESTAQIF